MSSYVQWWLASLGSVLVWARMTVNEHGSASVFDCDGNTLSYASEDSARAALLDADFYAWDGLDEDDAAKLGIDLATQTPPSADNDADLRERMVEKRPRKQ